MNIITEVKEWQQIRKTLNNKPIGLVPTMGNLHQGHASLIEQSVKNNEITILTIFINPMQFNNKEDLENYPKTLEKDCELAKELGVDYLLLPDRDDIYPDNYNFRVTENSDYSTMLEGEYRPGHFTGMLTIVLKLLLLTNPTRAYFGEKDYQQLQLVKAMAEAFLLETEIIPCPIIRNDSGLPLSSRNNRLTPKELEVASLFSKLLTANLSLTEIKNKLTETGFVVDYIEENNGRRLGAVKLGNIRLIDNVKTIPG